MAMSAAARPAAALAMLSLMICSLLQRSAAAPCAVSKCAAVSTAHASAGPCGTYPSSPPPPPPRTLSTVPRHPSIPGDAQWNDFVLSPSGRLFLPGRMQAIPALNESGVVTQCTLKVTFYEIHPDSGEVVQARSDTHAVNAAHGVLFDARAPRPCAAGLVGAAIDEAGGWLYYPVVASLPGPIQYDDYGGEVARTNQTVLLVRQVSLDGSGGSRTVLQLDTSAPNNVFENVASEDGRLSSSIALSGPADASAGENAGAAFLLLSPYESAFGYVLAVDLSGSGVVRARRVGLGVQATAWAIDQSTGSGTSTYDMYLLYEEDMRYDSDACKELAREFPFDEYSVGGQPCSSWWVARDKGAASAAAIAAWPVATRKTNAEPVTSEDVEDIMPGVDVEVIPYTLTTTTWPGPVHLAAGGSKVYLGDHYRCQIMELDPVTGAKLVAGYDGGSAGASSRGGCTRPVCSIFPSDGPATGTRPIASPGRMAADGFGALVVMGESTGRLRRLAPA